MPKITNKDILLQLGAEIRRVRKYRGMTQTELAEKMKAAQGYICKIETGNMELSSRQLANICNVLGMAPKIKFSLVKSG